MEVNYNKGGLFTVKKIDWYWGWVLIYTRSKHKSHGMYRDFWTQIENIIIPKKSFINQKIN